ncbi:hypothetical protein LTR70_005635 [Exophiala xenobiotica]|uniref:NACHT domain-containing protein n=1 Tax=Lithohypha guttulata TaxID=1690604 RepID=A0ABR0JYS2_9EURO|nr:hypothetical protein LTR24_008838 [Lithohypha guttulata]KAK5317955.1 hypothetical protein LTR70_005635 [Exophiala xenobiotica]
MALQGNVGHVFPRVNAKGNARVHLGDVHNHIELSNDQQKCHQAFKTSNYEQYKNVNPERAPDTCNWVTEHPTFKRWHESDCDELLWVSADPGCGKSVLSRYLVDAWLPQQSYDTVCYYFFKDNDEQSRLAPALAAILHQLFGLRRDLIQPCALSAWCATGDRISEEATQMWRILEDLKDTDPESRGPLVICVIDALDECRDNDRRQLIEFLCRLHANRSARTQDHAILKIMVTSRPYDSVERWFSGVSRQFPQIRLRGEDENDPINNEINLVIQHNVHRLAQEYNLMQGTKDRLLGVLLDMKHRTYLWLHLAIEDIREALQLGLLPDTVEVDAVPSSVEDAYERILAKVKAKQIPVVKRILKLIIAARRPLATEEVAIALALASRSDNDNSPELYVNAVHVEKQIREWCGLFVFIRDSKVFLIHQTAKEFLLTSLDVALASGTNWRGCMMQSDCELEMARAAVRYLLLDRFTCKAGNLFKRPGEPHIVSPKPDVRERADFFKYSAEHWAADIKHAGINETHIIVEQTARLCATRATHSDSWFNHWQYCKGRYVDELLEHHVAVLVGSLATLVYLYKTRGFDLDAATEKDQTALACALRFPHEEIIQVLLEWGTRVRWIDLQATARGRVDSGIFQVLFKRIPEHEMHDVTAVLSTLQTAVLYGNSKVVEILLKSGLIDRTNPIFSHADTLIYACRGGHAKMVQLLLEHGCDANVVNPAGDGALDWAMLGGSDTEIVRMLRAKGALTRSERAESEPESEPG